MAMQLLLAVLWVSPALAATTISLTSNGARLAALLVDPKSLTLLSSPDTPIKFTAPSISTGIIDWAPGDTHSAAMALGHKDCVVFTTGNARNAIKPGPYKPDPPPTYPDIVNANIEKSHDAVVLDFWVKPKKSGLLQFSTWLASSEGHPAAIKQHKDSNGYRDYYQFEVTTTQSVTSAFILQHEPGWPLPDPKKFNMQYVILWEMGADDIFPVTAGKSYRIKIRLADTLDRLVDSAAFMAKGNIRIV